MQLESSGEARSALENQLERLTREKVRAVYLFCSLLYSAVFSCWCYFALLVVVFFFDFVSFFFISGQPYG